MIAAPIPMLARPLDLLCGPPDPGGRMVPAVASHATGTPVWMRRVDSPRCQITECALNPGEPGQPEPLPWKRRPQ